MKYKRKSITNKVFKIEDLRVIIVLLFFIKPQIIDDISLLDIIFNV